MYKRKREQKWRIYRQVSEAAGIRSGNIKYVCSSIELWCTKWLEAISSWNCGGFSEYENIKLLQKHLHPLLSLSLILTHPTYFAFSLPPFPFLISLFPFSPPLSCNPPYISLSHRHTHIPKTRGNTFTMTSSNEILYTVMYCNMTIVLQ